MPSSRFLRLSATAALLCLAVGSSNSTYEDNPDSICNSYGVDFVDDGRYFINTASNDSFTCVSTFSGCNQDEAEVLFIDPAGNELFCSEIPTLPDDTSELSTCPVLKSQLVSGDYMILILGNNGDGQPYAWQRDIHLDCGVQITTTYTPTVTFSITTTPVTTFLSTSTLGVTKTISPNATYTIPSATAKRTHTITPPAVRITKTKTISRVSRTWTKSLSITTSTATASCTTLTSVKKDKPCTYSPTLAHPAALVTPTSTANSPRIVRKGDRSVNVEYARARIAAAKLRRDQNASAAVIPLVQNGPDQPTITVTASPPINATVTSTAQPSTTSELTVVTTYATTTLPPVTVRSGIFTKVVTLPTPTKTRVSVAYTTITSTRTFKATFTRTTTITPSAPLAACTKKGRWWESNGHYWSG